MGTGEGYWKWAVGGTVVVLVLGVLLWRFSSRETPSEQLVLKTRRLTVVSETRRALAAATEAEKSAVMAVTDKESQEFADQARTATATAESKRVDLAELLKTSGTQRERDLL